MVADVPKTPWWLVQAQPQDHRGECIGAAQTTQTAVPVTSSEATKQRAVMGAATKAAGQSAACSSDPRTACFFSASSFCR